MGGWVILPALMKVMDYLSRSQSCDYTWQPPLLGLTLVVLIVSVCSLIPLSGDEQGFVRGSPFGSSLPGIGGSAGESAWSDILGKGFMGFVRLVPVPDEAEAEQLVLASTVSLGTQDGNGCDIPELFGLIFDKDELMQRLLNIKDSVVIGEKTWVHYYDYDFDW